MPRVQHPTLPLNSSIRNWKWMSDVLQSQQSHPSSHQLVSSPMVVHATGSTLPGWEFPWYINSQQTADSGSSDHLSHQPCRGRVCLSWVRKPFALSQHEILLVSHAVAPPGGVIAESVENSSANPGRCKSWFTLYYRKGWFELQLWFVPLIQVYARYGFG